MVGRRAGGLIPLLLAAAIGSDAVADPVVGDEQVVEAPAESCDPLQVFPYHPADVSFDPRGFAVGKDWYREEDFESVAALCTMTLRDPADGEVPAHRFGVCPKIHGTLPGLEVYDLDGAGIERAAFERKRCPLPGWVGRGRKSPRAARKLAKFKTSTFHSEAESVLLYFHFSRLLGNLAHVEPATHRTVALADYHRWTTDAIRYIGTPTSKRNPLDGWSMLERMERAAPGRSARRVLDARERFVDPAAPDLVFGSIVENPRGEAEHNALCWRGAPALAHPGVYRKTPWYELLVSRRPVAELVNFDADSVDARQRALQRLSCARDFSHMILLDHLFNQLDRMGNVHERTYFHFIDDAGRLDWRKKAESVPAGRVAVPLVRLVLKDNDDALVWKVRSEIVASGLLAEFRHFDPVVYARMQWLAGLMTDPTTAAAVKRYFTDAVHVSAANYDVVRGRFLTIAADLARLADRGQLQLDLDLEGALRRR